MLVKELRQGLRTNLFVIAFILLQSFMILFVMTGLANPGSNDSDGFFWFLVISVMLGVQPLRGFNALADEHRLNTLELIQLTRLDSWRIVLGKWTALNAQGLLFLIGVLPYVALRYFLGSVDLLADAGAIGMIALGSALLTAFTIGVSVFPSVIVRGVLLCLVGGGAFIAANIYTLSRRYGGGPAFDAVWPLALVAVYGTFFFLAFGASRIAPLSQNLSTRKRLVAIGTAILLQGFWWSGISDVEGWVISLTGIVLGLATIDALTEPLPIFSRVSVPFRKSIFHRFGGMFLIPGWIAGIGFFVVCSVLWASSFFLGMLVSGFDDFLEIEGAVLILSFCNLIIFPLPLLHLFFARYSSESFTFGLYLFAQAALFGITIMVIGLANAIGAWEDRIYLAVPLPSVFVAANLDGDADESVHLIVAAMLFLLCILFPLVRQPRAVRSFLGELWGGS